MVNSVILLPVIQQLVMPCAFTFTTELFGSHFMGNEPCNSYEENRSSTKNIQNMIKICTVLEICGSNPASSLLFVAGG